MNRKLYIRVHKVLSQRYIIARTNTLQRHQCPDCKTGPGGSYLCDHHQGWENERYNMSTQLAQIEERWQQRYNYP